MQPMELLREITKEDYDDDVSQTDVKIEEPGDEMIGFGKEEGNIWAGVPAETNQEERFGHLLSHFRREDDVQLQVVGGRSKKLLYTVTGFRFQNLTETSGTIEESLVAVINDFVKEKVDKVDVKKKNVTLVLHHEKLRDNGHSLFMNLNQVSNPGELVLSFFERFGQSNSDLRIEDSMQIDFWIS